MVLKNLHAVTMVLGPVESFNIYVELRNDRRMHMENKHTISDLYQMQSLPLSAKIRMTKRRIIDWVEFWEREDKEVYL